MSQTGSVRAAAIQWDVQRGDVEGNLTEAVKLIAEAIECGSSIVVLPELWATSFVGDDVAEYRDAVEKVEREIGTMSGDLGIVITGSNYEFGPDGAIFNTARLWQDGSMLGQYRKAHLFSPHAEDRQFQAGETALVADTRFGRVAIAICYDLRFPELVHELALTGAEILLIPAQWPEPRDAHWNVLARARAIEGQWFVVATNRLGVEPSLVSDQDVSYPGNSLIVAPTGEVLAEGNGETGVVDAELRLKEVAILRRAIPVLKDRRPDFYAKIRDDLSCLRPG